MSCSCTFSPVTVTSNSDPSKHVNFSTGMVLGVEDYRQEFAYHAARDKWIVREIAGYGTLSGLGVALDQPDQDKLRVTAGTAAAPSGQLICVGADQCAMLNTWLQNADVAEKINAVDAAGGAPNGAAVIKVWLTLCYTNCAVAPVPIPGQPCRSEEDLMAPSRVADDYRLSLSFDPPEIGEADYLKLLSDYIRALPAGAAPASAAARRQRAQSIRRQARLLFAPDPAPIAATDAAALDLNAANLPELLEELRNLWITELRPQIVKPPCAGGSSNDCVMLGSLTMNVVRSGADWVIENGGGGNLRVDIDQSDRPFLQSLALAASPFGTSAVLPAGPEKQIAYLAAAGNIPAAADFALIRTTVANEIMTIVGGGAGRPERKLYIRNAGAESVRLQANNSGLIDGSANRDLGPGEFVYLSYDGAGSWFTRAGRR